MSTAGKEPMDVHCAECQHEWACAYLPMPVDLVVKLMKAPCPNCGSSKVLSGPIAKPTDEGDPIAWLTNGDTGTSSKTIWSVLTGRAIGEKYFRPDVPKDPSDFGRCYRLLQVMPSWRARLGEVAAKYPEWAALVRDWDALTVMYELAIQTPKKPAHALYERMQVLRDESALSERET